MPNTGKVLKPPYIRQSSKSVHDCLSIHSFDVKSSFTYHKVSKAIKNTELDSIVGNDHPYIRLQNFNIGQIQYKQTENGLIAMKKQYNMIKHESNSVENIIRKMKEEIDKLKFVQEEYEKSKPTSQQIYQQILYKSLELKWEKKCYQNKVNKLKEDMVIYSSRKQEKHDYLNKKKYEFQYLEKKLLQSFSFSFISQKLMIDSQSVRKDKKRREEQLVGLSQEVAQLHILKEIKQARMNQLRKIIEDTMQDKDQNQKQWKKLMLTNLLLRKMLKSKIQLEIEKYRILQIAYQEIKDKTVTQFNKGVSDANQIVNRFLNKESRYSNILQSISDSEKKIELEKKTNQKLKQKQKELKDKLVHLAEKSKLQNDSGQNHMENHLLQQIINKSEKIKQIRYRLHQLIQKLIFGINQEVSQKAKGIIHQAFQKINEKTLRWLSHIGRQGYRQMLKKDYRWKITSEQSQRNNRLYRFRE